MKNRVMSGWVTRTGPPRSIWRRKIGITEPDEPSTLPNRTATKRVFTSARAELDRDVRDHLRRQRVVAHRLDRVRLHQRHVLVRRRVEDDARSVALEDLAQLRPVLHVAEDR